MNRKLLALFAGTAALGLVAWTNAGPSMQTGKDRKVAMDSSVNGNVNQTSGGAPFETTGFEVPEWDAHTMGQSNFFCGAAYWSTCTATPIAASCTGNPAADVNCCIGAPNPLNGWFASGSSQHCREPHIEIANPASGAQHLRFVRDPQGGNPAGCVSVAGACRVGAFTPDMGPQIVGPNSQQFDIAASHSFGANFVYFGVDDIGAGAITTYMYFYKGGYIYIYDQGSGTFPNVGPWFYDGAYRQVRVDKDPCAGTLTYSYDGAVIYSTPLDEGPNFRRGILETDNGGDPTMSWDVDNFAVTRGPVCPAVCGDGDVEGNETCEPGVAGACPPGRCIGAGLPGECTCSRICTLAAPCPVTNGENGPFLSPFGTNGGFFSYVGDSPAVAVDYCGSTGIDSFIQIYDPAVLSAPVSSNDDCCNPADPNCGSFGAGSTPNASCYDQVGAPNYEACTCASVASNNYLIRLPFNTSTGVSMLVNVNKKAVCGGAVLGSCCDSNGADQGCVDNVLASACVGPDKTFNNEKCNEVTCACIPNCSGRVCGPDGCGGTCAPNNCSDGNVCNGSETCNDATGQCLPGQPLSCDNGLYCDGVEICSPASGCGDGPDPNCSDNVACTVDSCNEGTDSCDHTPNNAACDNGLFCDGAETCTLSGCVDGADPCDPDDQTCDEATDICVNNFTPIPTVSQWGLAVIALMLLIGAKIFFSRRQAAL